MIGCAACREQTGRFSPVAGFERGHWGLYPVCMKHASSRARVRVGQETTPVEYTSAAASSPDDSTFTPSGVVSALKRVTPTVLVLALFTGGAFALGSGIVNSLFFSDRK